jgi:hypothetical protein
MVLCCMVEHYIYCDALLLFGCNGAGVRIFIRGSFFVYLAMDLSCLSVRKYANRCTEAFVDYLVVVLIKR